MRNSILMSAFGVSMEDIEHFDEEDVQTSPELEFTDSEISDALDTAAVEAADVREHNDAVETLSETAESLESLLVSLESAIEAGGMDPQAGELYGRSLTLAARGLPVDASEYVVSTESFGGSKDKLTASMEAEEKTRNFLQRIWDTIRNALVAAGKALWRWVTTLGKGAAALHRAGKHLVKMAAELGNKTTDKAEVDCLNLARYIHVDGKFPPSVTGTLAKINANATKVNDSAKLTATYVKETVTKSVADGTDAEKAFEDMGDAFTNRIKNSLPSGTLPGGRTINVDGEVPKLEITNPLTAKTMKAPAMNKQDIHKTGVLIQTLARTIVEFSSKHYKGLEKDIEKHIASMDKEIRNMDMEKADTKVARARLKTFKKFATQARAVGPDYMHYMAVTAKATYVFGKRSVAAHKDPAAK